MSSDAALAALTKPGNVRFFTNLPLVENFERAGGVIRHESSGHWIFYRPDGRRILATDPDGNALHECEWKETAPGSVRLARARIRLDWGQWVGILPEGLVNETTFDLSRKPGWQNLRADDLRQMAAQALQLPLEEIRFFYNDDDLGIAPNGTASIRHKKDAFYVLDDGTFEHARFTACMGAMHWHAIDFLPVVELFQSLLPGTGSAAFELIRGLYDDQQEGRAQPTPLRYRGIPTYPSEAAYRLFGSFFIPQAPQGQDPFALFMEPSRSHEVIWLPAPDPPRRYFDEARGLCVTVKGETVLKATHAQDPTGLSFVQPRRDRPAPAGHALYVTDKHLCLDDAGQVQRVPIAPRWGAVKESEGSTQASSPSWRHLFDPAPPQVSPQEAFSCVLLYPPDDTEISELATQPFVADHLEDLTTNEPRWEAAAKQAARVLIDGFDASINACILLERPRQYLVLYDRPAYAQRHAQMLWNRLAEHPQHHWLEQIKMVRREEGRNQLAEQSFDMIYLWLSFGVEASAEALEEASGKVARFLAPAGLGFISGPRALESWLVKQRLHVFASQPVESLPTFKMHKSILPKATLHPGLTLCFVRRG